jgi:ABC-type nitrate/sulfonate/bicarbonate transport system substrate-binding protein
MKRLLLLTAMTLCLVACTKKDKPVQTGGTVKVRFGEISVGERSIPIRLGVEKGFFVRQGIDLVVRNFNGGSELMTAAAAGEIDAGNVGTPVILAAAKGVPVKVIGSPVAPGNPFVLVAKSGYATVADLKGKKVGAGNVGGGSRQAFLAIIKSKGLTLADFQPLDIGGSANAFAALQAGQIEATITSDMSAAKAELAGFGKVLARAADYFGRYQHSFFFATTRFIETRPDKVKGFLIAYRDSVRYAKEHPEEVIAFGAGKLELEEKPLRKVLTRAIPAWSESTAVDLEGTNNAIKAIKELGDLEPTNPITAELLVDSRFLPL